VGVLGRRLAAYLELGFEKGVRFKALGGAHPLKRGAVPPLAFAAQAESSSTAPVVAAGWAAPTQRSVASSRSLHIAQAIDTNRSPHRRLRRESSSAPSTGPAGPRTERSPAGASPERQRADASTSLVLSDASPPQQRGVGWLNVLEQLSNSATDAVRPPNISCALLEWKGERNRRTSGLLAWHTGIWRRHQSNGTRLTLARLKWAPTLW